MKHNAADFLGFSYGFRPGRSPHQALNVLYYALMKKKVNHVLDADIKGFFDNLDKSWLIKFVEHRVSGDSYPYRDPQPRITPWRGRRTLADLSLAILFSE